MEMDEMLQKAKKTQVQRKKGPRWTGKKGSQVDRDQKLRIEERTMLACDEI